MKVLITGVSSVPGRLVAELLSRNGHQVMGIDRRPWPGAPSQIPVHRVDLRKRPAEDVFRTFRPEAVVHMATVSYLERSSDDLRHNNLGSTKKVFEYCHNHGAKKAIFVGRHTVYGAASDSPIYHFEDAPPMAGSLYPELADLVAADLYAGQALWRYPELDSVILRIVYELGPHRHSTLATFLEGPKIPTILGFDPLFQFMHEHDIARAIVSALDHSIRGVFNVAGPTPVPLSLLAHETGRTSISLPEVLFPFITGRFGFSRLPPAALDHIKYPILVDDRAFRKATKFAHSYDESDAMIGFRTGDAAKTTNKV